MKKILIGAFCSALALLSSCDLDKFPSANISQDTSWQSISDARNFRYGIYSYLQVVSGGIHTYAADYQSDLFNMTVSSGNRGGDLHRWDFNNSQYDIEDIWQYNYTLINNCNNIINNIDHITVADETEQAEANNIKGEAYLMRAMAYHTLVLHFAKDYEPASAATDLGLPLVEVGDPNGKPSRATLEATYQLIKSDIEQARQLLSTPGEANSEFLTIDVIDAFEARVDLYMHNYQEARTLAQSLMSKYALVNTEDGLAGMWLNDEASEVLFRVRMTPDDRTNAFSYYLNWSTTVNHWAPDFIPSQWVVDLFEDGDIRKNTSFLQDDVQCNDIQASDIYLLNKYPGNPALDVSTEFEYYNMWKPFRAAEAYLIVAEAAYRDNDEAAALDALNQLRTNRNASALSVSGDALFQTIKEEWIREFVGEGQRLNDLKRWHDGFTRHDPQNPDILTTGVGMESLSIEADNMRFVWEIPANDLNANSNLVPNWNQE